MRSALHGHHVLISGQCSYLSDCADEHVDLELLPLHMPVRPFLLTGAFSFSGISANSLMNEVPYTSSGLLLRATRMLLKFHSDIPYEDNVAADQPV